MISSDAAKPASACLRAASVMILAAALGSCHARGGQLRLAAEAGLEPRLEAMLRTSPLPPDWSLADDAAISLSLAEYSPQEAPPQGSYDCGIAYRAAAVRLEDGRYSVTAQAARELGLDVLESIAPPLRALEVEGRWPGSPGYPFAYRLGLRLSRSDKGRIPGDMSQWAEAAASRAAASDRTPAILAAAGDMQVGPAQWPELLGGEKGLVRLFGRSTLDRLRGADLAVANLESPVSSRGEPNPEKRFHFRMPLGSSEAMLSAGLDLLLFANNHAFDYGPEAFDDTLGDLRSAGMPFAGAGSGLAEAAAARFLDIGPIGAGGSAARAAFVGYAFFPKESLGFTTAAAAAGPSSAGILADEAAALASIREAAASGAFVVVLAHGGSEYVEAPSRAAKELYARFVDAGAALVIGSHPHLLQGCSSRSGSLIAYSLGNFVFTDEREPPAAWKSGILEFLVYGGKARGFRIFPVIAGYEATGADPDTADAEARLSRLCAGLVGEGEAYEGLRTSVAAP